jgi:hypothetical protein
MYRFYMEHLKTTITNIDIYLCDRENLREMDLKMADFRGLAEQYEAEHDPNPKKKTTTRAVAKKAADPASADAGPSSSANVSDATTEALRFLTSLGSSYDKFGKACSEVLTCMISESKLHKTRVEKRAHLRYLCTGGLSWNVSSKARVRDRVGIAVSAVFESMFVPRYRPELIEKCSGVAAFRKQLSAYFLSIAQPNHTETSTPPQGEQSGLTKPVSEKKWFFADEIADQENPAPLLVGRYTELEEKLASSHSNFKTRKSNEINRHINMIRSSRYLQCDEKGVDPNTQETSSVVILNRLYRVSDPRAFPPLR